MLRVTERDLIKPGQPEMLQKLIIVLSIPLLCAGRHDADHLRENSGSAMVFQNTDSLRTILNIEFSEILIVPDRFAKSIIAQKLLIQSTPGICEFRIGLLSEIRRSKKWVNLGQQVHKYENLLARQFRADRPNVKWVTDISYIHTKEGVLYLSMIRDLYDNSIIAYKTESRQTVNLVLDTIRLAMKKEKKRVAAELRLHSDQGFQYTSQAYFKLTQSYGITPSMSSKGNPYDNAMAENFFSILKTECIYRHKPKTFKEANDLIDRYIHFYNYERIQTKTGVAPLTQRHSA